MVVEDCSCIEFNDGKAFPECRHCRGTGEKPLATEQKKEILGNVRDIRMDLARGGHRAAIRALARNGEHLRLVK